MKKRVWLFLLAIWFVTPDCFAQPVNKFIGDWEGKINVGGGLGIIFHVKENGSGGLSSTADSPDQGSYGMKCDTTFLNGEIFTIEIWRVNASFNGRLINDSTVDGKFTQGAEIPLTLSRKKENVSSPKANTPVAVNYKIVDVAVKRKDMTIYGTGFQPVNDNKSIAVLIIAGSGPTDRDGNSKLLPGKNNSLLQLADSLAQHGITTLRYDKRSAGQSKLPPGTTEENITIDDMAGDARAMFEWLKTMGYKNIFIAGHSEGSLIGLMIAADTKASGFISMAGAGRKAGDILKEQVAAQLPANQVAEFNKAIDSLEQGFSVKKIDPSLFNLLRPSVQPYMRSWLKQDPQQLVSRLRCPVLLLQGTNDLQVKEKDAQSLKAAQPKARLVMIKDMNHVLKEVTSDQVKDNVKAYSDPSLPVAHVLIEAIVQFIRQSSAR